MREEVLPPLEAWKTILEFLALPEVRFLQEPTGLDDQWGAFTKLNRTSPNLWTDAYLAAFAKCTGARLVTFDKGFTQFPDLEPLILTPDRPTS